MISGRRLVATLMGGSTAYLTELVGGLLILGVANAAFWPGDPGFLTVEPHPALLVVALVAARHGLRAGLMAGGLSAALVVGLWIRSMPELSGAALRSPGRYVTPLVLLGAGFLLGTLREEARRAERTLGERVRELEEELADQAVRFLAASEARHELERRVADESGSITSLYAAARSMETLDMDRLYPAVVATAQRFLGADACQCYVLEGELLRLRAAEGEPPTRVELRSDEGLVGLAIRRGRPVSIRDLVRVATLEDLSGAEALMAAPLLDHGGALLGCLTVTRLPFLKLTPSALDRLGLAADWASRALENARQHERARARTIEDEIVGAYTYSYYQRRLSHEQLRAQRYARPLSVIIFRMRELERVRPEQRTELARVLALVFSRTLRDSDLVCRYATEDSFALILPETSQDNAERLGARLASEIQAFQFAPYTDEERELDFTVRVLPVPARAEGPVGR